MQLDFLIIGAQKSGTTSLRRHLAKNYDVITMSPRGELHFFDDEKIDWAQPNYTEYHARFFRPEYPQQAQGKLGECTPIYLYWRPCMARIHAYNPSIKLIILLRNPMQRAFSHWSMERSRNREPLDFAEAIRSEKLRCATAEPLQQRTFSYLDRGRYFEQLSRIFSLFPQEQVLVIKAEEFFLAPDLSLDRIEGFLDCRLSDRGREHKRGGVYGTALEPDDWHWMYANLAADIHQLEKLLNWNCQDWHQPPPGP